MHFQGMQFIFPAGSRSRDWLSALPGLVQCRHHRTLPASTPPFFDRPHRDPFRLYYRYVDNRFIAFNSTFLKHLAIRTLIHPDFYGNPANLHQRTISYIPPDAPWKIRDHASAGSTRLRLSGLHSRAHLIRKYTYPSSAVERALAQLADLYVQKGHDLRSCRQALKKAHVLAALASQRVSPCRVRRPRPSVRVNTCFQGSRN